MTISDVVESLENAETPLFVTHRHADRDSLGSAIGLRTALGRGMVCAPDGVSAAAQSLFKVTDSNLLVDPDPTEFDTIVVLDAPSVNRIAPIDPAEPVLIDHHERGDLSKRAVASVVDTNAGATAELVERVIRTGDWELTPVIALPLLVGLLDDTGFLRSATPDTVASAVRLVGGLDEQAKHLPKLVTRASAGGERTAKALGTLRARGYRAGETITAVTNVGGYESAAANALRSAGVDLAVVYSRQSNGARVTARATDRMIDQVTVGNDLLPALADEFGGDGGGHAGAGSATLQTGSIDDIEAFVIAYLEAELGMVFSEITR